MKIKIKLFALLFQLLMFSSFVFSQSIQDKIYVFNDTCLVPQVDGKVAQLCFEAVDLNNPIYSTCYELPIGLLGAAKNSIKYTLQNGLLISASFKERQNQYKAGPGVIAVGPMELRSLNEEQVREYLSLYKRTYHGTLEMTYLDGVPLQSALFENDFKELHFDFISNEKGDLFVAIIVNDKLFVNGKLEVWKLLSGSDEILYWSSPQERIKKEKETFKAELFLSTELKEETKDVSTFSMNDELYMFNHGSGNIYKITKSGINLEKSNVVPSEIIDASSLVIDKDNKKVFLLSKSILKNERKSFKELLERYGVEVPLPN